MRTQAEITNEIHALLVAAGDSGSIGARLLRQRLSALAWVLGEEEGLPPYGLRAAQVGADEIVYETEEEG